MRGHGSHDDDIEFSSIGGGRPRRSLASIPDTYTNKLHRQLRRRRTALQGLCAAVGRLQRAVSHRSLIGDKATAALCDKAGNTTSSLYCDGVTAAQCVCFFASTL